MRARASSEPARRGPKTHASWPAASRPRRSVSTEIVTLPQNGRELLVKSAIRTSRRPSGLVELLEILRLDVLQPLAELFRIVGLDGLRLLGHLEALRLADDFLVDVDRGRHAEGERDGVRGARVHCVLGLAELEVQHGEEGVFLEVGHDHLEHAGVERLEDVLDEVVGHRTRRRDLFELEGDGVRLEDADPDLQRPLVLLVAEDDDRHVRDSVQGQSAHLHFDKHAASSGREASVPRRLCGTTWSMWTCARSPTDALPCPSKLTTRLQRVRPDSSPAFFFEVPSTSTSTVRPVSRPLRSAPTRVAASRSRVLRLAFTSSANWSAIVAAGVPGRRE